MIVLGLDTSTTACSVAIIEGERVLAARSEPMARGHQERLAGLVEELMGEAVLSFDQLDRIACTVGPGSFTGLRVGMAFAKTMGLALEIPAVGVGTLEALAATARAQSVLPALTPAKAGPYASVTGLAEGAGDPAGGLGPGLRRDERGRGEEGEPVYAAAIDARRQQVYVQAFSEGRSILPAQAWPAEVAAAALSGFDAVCLAGSGAPLLAEHLSGAVVIAVETPDPVVVARLGAAIVEPRPMQPIYLRAPDAKLPI